MIIDQRGNQENATVLQNEFLDIICTEKDRVYSKFISKSSSTINVEIHKQKVRSLEQDIKKKEVTIAQLTTVNTKAAEVIKQLQKKVIELQKQLSAPIIKRTLVNAVVSPKASPVMSPRVHTDETVSAELTEITEPNEVSEVTEVDKDDILFDTSDEYYE
jgi:hypothetical protein